MNNNLIKSFDTTEAIIQNNRSNENEIITKYNNYILNSRENQYQRNNPMVRRSTYTDSELPIDINIHNNFQRYNNTQPETDKNYPNIDYQPYDNNPYNYNPYDNYYEPPIDRPISFIFDKPQIPLVLPPALTSAPPGTGASGTSASPGTGPAPTSASPGTGASGTSASPAPTSASPAPTSASPAPTSASPAPTSASPGTGTSEPPPAPTSASPAPTSESPGTGTSGTSAETSTIQKFQDYFKDLRGGFKDYYPFNN